MVTRSIESPAFHRAALASERLRIASLMAVIAIMVAVVLIRSRLPGEEETRAHLPRILAVVAVFFVHESLMLRSVARALRAAARPPQWIWAVNILVETSLPSAVMLIGTLADYPGPYRSLVSPAALGYMLFLILSILHLSPLLCLLTGAVAAAQYLALAWCTFHWVPVPPPGSGAFTFPVYVTFAVVMVCSGLAAAAVARQTRVHLIAALREAATREEIRRLERDLDIARSIQQGLLPRRRPDLRGYDIAGWSRPADQTGGDYFDWQELAGGRLVVSLADVSGHGIGPALVTAVCRAYARASFLGGDDFGELINRIHRLLAEDLPADRFITFVAALLDQRSRTVQMLSAGHGPIFLYRAEADEVEVSHADDVPFGVLAETRYGPARRLDMHPGDTLVLLTDGFFEWVNIDGEPYGVERLCRTIRSARHLPAAAMIQHLHTDVLNFSGGTPQADDLTGVVIKRLAV